MVEQRLEREKQRLKGKDAVEHINGNIFNQGAQSVNFVNYEALRNFTKKKIDFASISDEQPVQRLADIVDKIFVRIQRAEIDAIDFTSGLSSSLLSLNAFLLKLAETGLNSEQLSAIKTKYDAKFGQHIELTMRVNTNNVIALEMALGGNATNGNPPTISAHQKIVTDVK